MSSDEALNRTKCQTGYFPAEWIATTVDQLCDIQTGPFGSQLHQEDYVERDGTPIITVEHLQDGQIRGSDAPLVSDIDRDRLARFQLRAGDIVFSRVGSVDRSALATEKNAGWLFSGRCLRARPTSSSVDPHFLSYYFRAESVLNFVRRIAVGATMPSINTAILGEVPVCLPSVQEQRRIAWVLGALDDKIELNRKMAKTLEETAAAIFKARFVDFEGVEEFEDSEIGPIPEGWQVASIGEHADVVRGRSYSSAELEPSDTALVTLKSVQRGGGYSPRGAKPFTGDFKESQVVQPGEIVLAHTDLTQARDVIGRPAIIEPTPPFRQLVASLDLAVVRPKTVEMTNQLLFGILSSRSFREHAFAHSNGSTVLHLNSKATGEFRFALAPSSIVSDFEAAAGPLRKRSALLGQEARTLRSLRDELLPKLISGKIRVPEGVGPDVDPEEVVEELVEA